MFAWFRMQSADECHPYKFMRRILMHPIFESKTYSKQHEGGGMTEAGNKNTVLVFSHP